MPYVLADQEENYGNIICRKDVILCANIAFRLKSIKFVSHEGSTGNILYFIVDSPQKSIYSHDGT